MIPKEILRAVATATYGALTGVSSETAREHFEWYDRGKDNPKSCVHYSNVAKAYSIAEAALTAALSSQWSGIESARKWRHKKRGTEYEEVGRAEIQSAFPILEGDHLVIYRAADGSLWARPVVEFEDGRFEPLPPPTPEEKTGE